jgi:predicted small integral membrane protein
MTPARLAKTGMVASLALFTFVVMFDNIVDYDANFSFVRHVLSMDTTFPDDPLRWRAVAVPALWNTQRVNRMMAPCGLISTVA